MTRLRNYFLTGFIAIAPLAITAWLTWTVIGYADGWVKPYIPARYTPEAYLPFAIPGFGLVVALVMITLVGFLTANLIGRSIMGFGERLLGRMPLVRTVYTALKQILQTVLADRSSSFKKAALIEYPRRGAWAVVFVATDARGEVKTRLADQSEDMVAVFLPPTPNPTAGYLLFVPRAEVRILDMSVESAMKLVVSAGLVTPEDDTDRTVHDRITQAEAARRLERAQTAEAREAAE